MFNLCGVIFCLGFGSGFVIYYLVLSIRAEIEDENSNPRHEKMSEEKTEQREEVLEVIEDFSVFDLISDKLDAGGDPAFISWKKIDERVRQDLKQKLESEAREE